MRRLRWALLASVLLHLGLVLWLRTRPNVVVSSPAPAAAARIEVEVSVVAPPSAAPPPPAEAAAPRRPPRKAKVTPPAPVEASQPTAARSAEDSPVARTLEPSAGVVTVAPEPSRGRTIYNVPVDAAVARAEEAEVVRGRVQTWADDELASARVTNGLVDPYYYELRRELTAGLVKPPPVFTPGMESGEQLEAWAAQLVQSWEAGAQRYAATGAPYEAPAWKPSERVSQLEADAQRGDPAARAGVTTLYMGERMRDFAEGRAAVDLVAIVEVLQSATEGRAQLLKESGVKPYDLWVVRTAELSLDALAAAPPDGGARSIWEFRGRVSYTRSMKDLDAKDAWYLVLMALPGLAPGTFDETTGDFNYVDLRHPHYEARVKLLRVY